MVNSYQLMAVMAAIASAAPTTKPTSTGKTAPALIAGTVAASIGLPVTAVQFGTDVPLITASAGFTPAVAVALGACSKGVNAGVISSADKLALQVYLNGAGKTYFDAATISAIIAWTNGPAVTVLATPAIAAIEISLLGQAPISAAVGGVLGFLNGVIVEAHGGAHTCACSAVAAPSLAGLSAFINANLLSLSVNVLGALKMAAAGGLFVSLAPEAQSALTVYLASANCSLTGDLKAAVQAFTTVGSLVNVDAGLGGLLGADITIGGAAPATTSALVGANIVLSEPLSVSLNKFISGPLFVGLSLPLQTALTTCTNGGLAAALSSAMHAALQIYLSSPTCAIDAALVPAIQLWLGGLTGTGVTVAPAVSAPFVNVSLNLLGATNVTGSVVPSVQASLGSFLSSPAAINVDAQILAPLKACAAGAVSATVPVVQVEALVGLLQSGSSTLAADVKANLLMWLSAGVTAAPGASAGVGSGAGLGLALDAPSIVKVQAALGGLQNLTTGVTAGIHAAISGLTVNVLSTAGRAELAAYVTAAPTVTGLSAEVSGLLTAFLAGSGAGCGCSK